MADQKKLPSMDERLAEAGGINLDPVSSSQLQKQPPEMPPMSEHLRQSLASIHGEDIPGLEPPPSHSRAGIEQFSQNLENHGFDVPLDPFHIGKKIMGDFQNPDIQNQFYERYAEHPEFEKLGFNPLIDNEALYNEHASWWDDTRRAGSQAMTLGWLGFKDAMGFGDLADTDVAREYERAMAIGSSSKGGVGGFTTNLMLNSGYTLGIMNELAMEEGLYMLAEAGLAYAGVFTGGTAWAGNVAVAAQMGARAGRAGSKIAKAWKTARNLNKTLDSLKDVNKARTFFQKAGGKTVDFLNPVSNTTDYLRAVGKMDDLSSLGKTVKGFGEFYKDVRNIRLAYGEGALEGGMVQNQMTKDLLQEFKDKHGRLPNEEESAKIRQAAVAAGHTTALANIPAIFFSNKVMFDGLISGRFKNFQSSIVKTGLNEKMIFNPRAGLKEAYKAIPSHFAKAKWTYLKNPKLLIGGAAKYTKANFMEGTQEIIQEALAGASEDYYKAKFHGDPLRGGYMNYLASNMKKQMTTHQGFETFMSGFLMGGMVSPISRVAGATVHGKESLSNAKMFFADNAKWKKLKEERRVQLEEDVEKLNEFYANPEQYFSPDLMNLLEQKEFTKAMKIAQANGDTKTFMDMKDSAGAKHILTAARYGRLGNHVQRLEELQGLSDEEIMESWPEVESPEAFREAMNVATERAKTIEKTWNMAKSKYANPFNPSKFTATKQPEEFIKEKIKHQAWESAVEEMVFHRHSFDRALQRQQEILKAAKDVSGLKEASYGEFNTLFDVKSTVDEIGRLRHELHGDPAKGTEGLKGVEALTPEMKKIIKEKEEKLEKLEAFDAAMTQAMQEQGENESLTEETDANVRKALSGYMNYLTKKNGEFSSDDAFDKTMDLVIDYYLLGERAHVANSAVNTLLNPKHFIDFFNRTSEVHEVLHDNRKAEIQKSLEAYLDIKDANDVLNELFKLGLFFDPQEFTALRDEGKLPTAFYEANDDRTVKSEAPVTGALYKQAVDILRNYYEHLHGVVIEESQYDPYAIGQSRSKSENDDRTYSDIAEQFGFDPTAGETKVPLKKVLETIAKSPHSTQREKELAAKLNEIADEREHVVFTNTLSVPGEYSELRQTVIDARYSSNDYGQGKQGPPIEHVILHKEILRRTSEALKDDQAFRGDIQSLFDQAKKTFDELTEEDKVNLTGSADRVLNGLMSIEEFTAEAMGNEHFQKFLATVQTDTKTDTKKGWKKFVDLVIEKITAILGKPNGTVLNAAMDVITTKMDNIYGEGTVTVGSKTAPITEVTNKTPIAEMRKNHPELLASLVQSFRDKNQERIEDGHPAFVEDLESLSPEQITTNKEFLLFVRNPQFVTKEEIIRQYNKDREASLSKAAGTQKTGQTYITTVSEKEYADFLSSRNVSPTRLVMLSYQVQNKSALSEYEQDMIKELKPEIDQMIKERSAPIPAGAVLTEQMRKQLRDMGYSLSFVDPSTKQKTTMTYSTAQRYIAEKLTREDRDALETAPLEDPKLAALYKSIREGVAKRINEVGSYEEWVTLRNDLQTDFGNQPEMRNVARLSQNELEEMLDNKLKELAFSRKFEDVVVGEVIMMNNKPYFSKARVESKTENEIVVKNIRGKGETWTIKKEDMEKRVKYLYSEALSHVDTSSKPEITEEDKDIAAETNEVAQDIHTPEQINADVEKGESTDKSERVSNIFENIC